MLNPSRKAVPSVMLRSPVNMLNVVVLPAPRNAAKNHSPNINTTHTLSLQLSVFSNCCEPADSINKRQSGIQYTVESTLSGHPLVSGQLPKSRKLSNVIKSGVLLCDVYSVQPALSGHLAILRG